MNLPSANQAALAVLIAEQVTLNTKSLVMRDEAWCIVNNWISSRITELKKGK